MPTVAQMLGRDEGWRPSKPDQWELHRVWGAGSKERHADLHQYLWLNFKKESSKDLAYTEFEEAMRFGECDVRNPWY